MPYTYIKEFFFLHELLTTIAKLERKLLMDIEAAKLIGAGLAVIGVIGSGIGIGTIFASFIQAVGRNPAAQAAVFPMTMLGFALVEAIALFALVIALVILFG
jgi:F-type H+-transporting ATPase subunit c